MNTTPITDVGQLELAPERPCVRDRPALQERPKFAPTFFAPTFSPCFGQVG